MRKAVFDCEVSPTKSMVGFMDVETKKVKQFDSSESEKIKEYVESHELIGFNSLNYDDIMVTEMINGTKAKHIYDISVDLIELDGNRWNYDTVFSSIDLIEVAQGQASLKLYGARLGTKKLQDLPYNPHEKHTKKMWKEVCKYNKNDLQMTLELYKELKPQLELRANIGKQYETNVMSKGEAQIATAIYYKLLDLKSVPKQKIPESVTYEAPDYIKFDNPDLNDLLEKLQNESFEMTQGGSPILPEWLKKLQLMVDDVEYTIGIGGIHSKNKSEVLTPTDDEVLIDSDVASLYPSLMIQNEFYPEQISEKFGREFKKIYDRRQEAKRLSK